METFDPESYDLFQEWLDSDHDLMEILWPLVNPSMSERKRVRKAALVVLASPNDRHDIRGRCHLLMHGEGGTGKSLIRNWAVRTFDNAVPSGPSDSEAGLKADMSGTDPDPGALTMADDGYLGIDELDEYPSAERGALLEAMSDGHYTINKGAHRETFDANTRVIAAANRISHFREELLDRFDFIVEVEEYGVEETVTVSDDLYQTFYESFVHDNVPDSQTLLRDYLAYIDGFDPGLEASTIREIKTLKNDLIRDTGMAGDIRGKESWLRVAYTIAKLNKRDITVGDFSRAVRLTDPDLFEQSTLAIT